MFTVQESLLLSYMSLMCWFVVPATAHSHFGLAFTGQKNNITIHQVTTMLSASKIVLFPGHNHLLTTGADDNTSGDNQCQVISTGG